MTITEYTAPPSNIDAERYVLSAMMNSPQAVVDVAETLGGPHDFYRPLHEEMFMAMVSMFAASEPITPVTLRAWLDRYHSVSYDPMYLMEIYGLHILGEMAAAHARLIWEAAIRRNISAMGLRFSQLAADEGMSPAEIIAKGQQFINQLAAGAIVEESHALTTDEFLALDGKHMQPVIPGLIDHEDRVVVVGGEGDGKSTLAYQVAYCLAAGVHPFRQRPIPSMRTLIVDLENPQRILQQRLAALQKTGSRHPGWVPGNVTIWAQPGGIDIMNAGDAFRLADMIRVSKADLVVCGPIYKMFHEGERDGPKHAAITRFFDMMRQRYGIAVWLESHAPIIQADGKRIMRPLGSGIWTRWPEFGISLVRAPKKKGEAKSLILDRFRGDRDDHRIWPEKITRNRMPGVVWPWLATYPEGTLLMDPLTEAE